METTRVVNMRREKYEVYIGRPSQFGNPFSVKMYGREGCIAKYKDYFYRRIANAPHNVIDARFKRCVEALKGKILGCYCKPLHCHGDIIVEYLEEKGEKDNG